MQKSCIHGGASIGTTPTTRGSIRRSNRRAIAGATAIALTSLLAHRAPAAAVNVVWTNSGGTNLWNNASNWSPMYVPNNNTNGFSDYNVSIGTPSPTYLTISPTIDNLTMNNGGVLDIQSGSILTLNGPNLVDNGSIVINSNEGGSLANLAFAANTAITGSGTISLSNNSNLAQLNGSAGVTVSQSASHTIAGFGVVNLGLTNNGTVNANFSGQALILSGTNENNNLTFEATGSGTLNISGITVTQGTAGQIEAVSGNVNLTDGTTIAGGSIQSSSGNTVTTTGTVGLNAVTIAAGANFYIAANSTANVSGGLLTNNGTVRVDDFGGSPASLNFSSNTLLTGSGNVYLYDNGPRALLTAPAGVIVTVDTNQLIHGTGDVDAALTNYGTVNADYNGQSINLQTGNTTNDNLLEATSGGTLSINGITVTQGTHGSTSGNIYANGGSVNLTNGTTIVGGQVQSNGSSGIYASGATTLSAVTIATGSNVYIAGNATVNISGGSLTNNGTIRIDDFGGSPASLNFNTATLLTGTGTIQLYDNGPRATFNSAAGVVVTLDANQLIHGTGDINAALTNYGTVNADYNGQSINLQTGNTTNDNLLEATSGGTLSINGITVTQGTHNSISGVINALSGNVDLTNNATIVGGTVMATNGSTGIFITNTSGTFTNVTLPTGTNTYIAGGGTLTLTAGTITNNGTIRVSDDGGTLSYLKIAGNVTLAGTGTISLFNNGDLARIVTVAGATLTVGASQTINGFGDVDGQVTNNGLIDASFNGQVINLSTSPNAPTGVTNNATIEATAGGVLSINSITLTQSSAATLTTGNGSYINLNSSNVSGGIISSTGNGAIYSYNSVFSGSPNISSGSYVLAPSGYSLTILGPTLANYGTIQVETSGGGVSNLNFNSSTVVSGTGSILLYDNSHDAVLTTASGAMVTIGANQTIDGFGDIDANLVNNGLINANVNGQYINLYTSPNASTGVTNNATIEATGGGLLSINSITLTQSATATLLAANTSGISLNSSNVSGGTLSTAGSGYIYSYNSIFAGSPNISTGSYVLAPSGYSLTILGPTLANYGTIQVETSGGGVSNLNFNSSTVVSGTGSILLYDNSHDAVLTTASGAMVTIGANQTIDGFGDIDANLVNNGLINANVNGQYINLYTSPNASTGITNNSTIEATGGGAISINSITLTQAANATLSVAGNRLDLNNATVSGGTLSSSGGATIYSFNSTLAGSPTIAAGSYVLAPSGYTLAVVGPTLTNNGEIQIETGGGGVSYLNFNTSTAVNGTGSILLYDNDSDARLTTLSGATVTIGASQTIDGFGDIDAVMVNNGTINANINGQAINLNGTISGVGAFQASGGGILAVSGSLTVNAGGLLVGAASGSSFVINSGGELIDNGSETGLPNVTNNGTLTFSANPNTGIKTHNLYALNIGSTGITTVSPSTLTANRTLLVTSMLNFAGYTNNWAGILNLANNDMDVTAGNLATISNQISEGFNNGKWNGPGGIVSSSAAANTTHLTALGSIQNNQSGTALFTASHLFDGIAPGAGDILVKYTYYGDANLDGKVDGSDYSLIDNGYLNSLTGWFNGDFNYDGVVNGSDYTLIDNAFNTQGTAITSELAGPSVGLASEVAGPASVPEPVMIGAIGLVAMGLLGRRRRALKVN